MPCQRICPPARVTVTIRKVPLKFTICCLSQFKEDKGKPSVCAQQTNPITQLLQTDDGATVSTPILTPPKQEL